MHDLEKITSKIRRSNVFLITFQPNHLCFEISHNLGDIYSQSLTLPILVWGDHT